MNRSLQHAYHKYKWKKMVNGKWRYYYYDTEESKKNNGLLDTTVRIGPKGSQNVTVYKGKIHRSVDTVAATSSVYAAKGRKYVSDLLNKIKNKKK